MRDDLSGVLDDATLVSSRATRGATVVQRPYLSWHGDLPVGGRAVVTYTLRVKNPAAGDRRLDNSVTVTAPGASCATGPGGCRAVVGVADQALPGGGSVPGGGPDRVPTTGPAAATAGYLAGVLIILGGVALGLARRARRYGEATESNEGLPHPAPPLASPLRDSDADEVDVAPTLPSRGRDNIPQRHTKRPDAISRPTEPTGHSTAPQGDRTAFLGWSAGSARVKGIEDRRTARRRA